MITTMTFLRRFAWLAAALTLLLQACSLPARLEAVPQAERTRSEIPGIPNARYWVGDDPAQVMEEGMAALDREKAARAAAGETGPLPPANYLAVSGGGDNGAFGAGLLVGWTEHGDRPEFKIVTGISTGALIAPFAFLGSDWDDELREVYTTISPDKVMSHRGFLAALFNDAMADNAPLAELVNHYADQKMLDAIGAEYDKGRMLMIGTTDLDARIGVIWNIGRIAKSGSPNALELFHKILIASAAVPGAFPPVMIDTEIDGKPFQEMHVDGGAAAQVFLYPASVELGTTCVTMGLCRDRRLFIIRNARLDPDWAQVERQTLSIAARAISMLIQSQGIGDLYRIYATSRRDEVDYNLAYIGSDFTDVHAEEFDNAFMRKLFDYGYNLGKNRYPWAKVPPYYVEAGLSP
jgi:predicted acylesterase/phospholipase RssA